MPPNPAASRRVRAWARGALLLEAGRAWDLDPAGTPEPVADLLEVVQRHRVAELLASQADGLGLPAEIAQPLVGIRAASRRAAMVQVLETGRVQGLFAEAEVPCLMIKGPALAVQSAGDPAARGAGDVDVLVAPERIEDAYRLLADHGWRLREGTEVTPGTWAWRHVIRSFNAFTFDGPGSTVDLHWRLDPTLDALPDFAVAWQRREQVNIGGLVVPTLAHADLLAHTSLHTAKDSWRWMRSLVDVHRLARDPRTWERPSGSLRRLEVSTLAVTREIVGLPDGVPAEVLALVDRVPSSVLARARAAQDRPVYATYPFPGTESLRLLRYMVAASPTRRDLGHSVVSTVLPVKAVVGIESRSGWTGVPLTLWYRIRRLRRRSVAWVRREPGAGVVEPLVRTPR
ncbi:MAG TPA: nucleotidyltransferase family protein [Marmoricola sp.]|nr:nucleotidyltransferase family protein [Marmoricola sp.]